VTGCRATAAASGPNLTVVSDDVRAIGSPAFSNCDRAPRRQARIKRKRVQRKAGGRCETVRRIAARPVDKTLGASGTQAELIVCGAYRGGGKRGRIRGQTIGAQRCNTNAAGEADRGGTVTIVNTNDNQQGVLQGKVARHPYGKRPGV